MSGRARNDEGEEDICYECGMTASAHEVVREEELFTNKVDGLLAQWQPEQELEEYLSSKITTPSVDLNTVTISEVSEEFNRVVINECEKHCKNLW